MKQPTQPSLCAVRGFRAAYKLVSPTSSSFLWTFLQSFRSLRCETAIGAIHGIALANIRLHSTRDSGRGPGVRLSRGYPTMLATLAKDMLAGAGNDTKPVVLEAIGVSSSSDWRDAPRW